LSRHEEGIIVNPNPTILIVDDSPTTTKFVSLCLRNAGYHVLIATDGMEALEKLAGLNHEADLIITDLNMPNLDGYGLIAAVRHRDNDIPIIILSSEIGPHDRSRGIKAGADAYLTKPFQSAELLAEVARQLRASRFSPALEESCDV
jgi:DNA-binding response OmpR family regulator